MRRLQLGGLAALLLALLLAACGADATPTAVPVPPTATPLAATSTQAAVPATNTAPAPAATTTAPPAAPTETAAPPSDTPAPPRPSATQAAGPARATSGLGGIPVGLFTVPTVPPTPAPNVVPMAAIINPATNDPDTEAELNAYWKLFYQARTIAKPGDKFNLATVSGLTAPPYRDYTLTLLEQSQADIDAGKLQQVTYSDIRVLSANGQGPGPDGIPIFNIDIQRTQTQVRTDIKQAPQTLQLSFRLKRIDLGNGKVSWQAYDFLNPATNAWLSESLASQIPVAQVQSDMTDFFQRFYTARTLTAPGSQFDFDTTGQITAGAYQDYTLPLLQQQQDQVNAGQITKVTYSDIKAQVTNWDPNASAHGGLATVAVTRTSHVQRPGKPEEVQTATYQFRLHRHLGDDGKPFWLAVDFLSPITNKWVSESAGMSGPIPEVGHG